MVHTGAASGLGRDIVLGLLVEGPANCYQLDRQLRKRFESFDYAAGTARQAVKGLANDGLVRACQAQEARSGDGGRAVKLYEVTPAGREHFRWWMRRSISSPPVREELEARIALCRQEDLPRLIEIIRDAEAQCLSKVQALNRELRELREGQDTMEWRQRTDLMISSGKQAWWESRIRWLQRLRVCLEEDLANQGGHTARVAVSS